MKNKKILCVIIGILLLISIVYVYNFINSKSSFNNDKFSDIVIDKENKVINVLTSPDMLYNLSEPSIIEGLSDYIALVKIDTIDGVSNINKKTNEFVSTYTYGKLTILEMIKGNIDSENISYSRSGGEISYNDWIKGQLSPEKLQKMVENSGIDTNNLKIVDKYEGDISIEINKVYLAYMHYEPSFNEENEYVIHGFQYGLREIKEDESSNIKVKNNDTGKWENLSSIIDTNMK